VGKLETWADWLFQDDNWRVLLILPIVLIVSVVGYLTLLADNPLSDRKARTEIFDSLVAEMEGMELPPNSGINKTEARHKASSILITRVYRTDASRDDFLQSIHTSLVKRGWIPYPAEQDSSAVSTYSYCRGTSDATLYLKRKGIFNSDPGDYWQLQFSVGLRSKPRLGTDGLSGACRQE